MLAYIPYHVQRETVFKLRKPDKSDHLLIIIFLNPNFEFAFRTQ